MPAGLDPLERELAEIDAEFEQTPPEIRKKFGVIPIIVLFFVLVTFSGLLWYSYSENQSFEKIQIQLIDTTFSCRKLRVLFFLIGLQNKYYWCF